MAKRTKGRVMMVDSPETNVPETTVVEGTVAACNGGGGALGHPLVYLNLGDEGEAVCPYCSRRFVLAAGAPRASMH